MWNHGFESQIVHYRVTKTETSQSMYYNIEKVILSKVSKIIFLSPRRISKLVENLVELNYIGTTKWKVSHRDGWFHWAALHPFPFWKGVKVSETSSRVFIIPEPIPPLLYGIDIGLQVTPLKKFPHWRKARRSSCKPISFRWLSGLVENDTKVARTRQLIADRKPPFSRN